MAKTGDKKAFCVLEFAKSESTAMMKLRFHTMYHTDTPMDKTIREWHKKFQQGGGLCAEK
jgi:hypothetical protein